MTKPTVEQLRAATGGRLETHDRGSAPNTVPETPRAKRKKPASLLMTDAAGRRRFYRENPQTAGSWEQCSEEVKLQYRTRPAPPVHTPIPVRRKPKASARRSKEAADKDPLQFYETPIEAVEGLLRHITLPRRAHVLDLGTGKGALCKHLQQLLPGHALTFSCVDVKTYPDSEWLELGHKAGTVRDLVRDVDLTTAEGIARIQPLLASADFVISNPPFKWGEIFARAAVPYLAQLQIAYLLPLTFMETPGRETFHRLFPSDAKVFGKRPKFSGAKHAGMSAYAWFLWGQGRTGTWGML